MIHIVKLPRRRRPASYTAQFVTLDFIFEMWCRRSALNLFGMQGNRFVSRDEASYRARRVSVYQRLDADHFHRVLFPLCGDHHLIRAFGHR